MSVWLMIAAASAAGAVPAERTCEATRQAMRPGWSCVETSQGVVVAASRERADQLAALATIGEARFRTGFAKDTPAYAVVEMNDGVVDAGLDKALKGRGVRWRLPWLSQKALMDGLKASIARAVTAKAEMMNLGAEQTAALVGSALAQQAARFAPEALQAKEASALPHELGHGWLTKSFWPDAATRANDHYGGPAPDWMDETAAVLMEDNALADSRRRQFRAIYDGADAQARARLIDLTLFLAGGHPALPKIDLAGAASGVRVLTGDEAVKIAAAAGTFYMQARLFADYVFARSGDPAAFRSAAEAFAAGRTTTEWLAAGGSRLRLPTSLAALQIDWEAWLKL